MPSVVLGEALTSDVLVGGGLVLFSSLVAFQGVPRAAHYAATKAYIQSLAEGLHVELAPLGVDVIASAPGPIHSGFAERANMQMGLALQPEEVARGTPVALGRKMTVRPGWLSKFLEAALTLPRALRVRMPCGPPYDKSVPDRGTFGA